MKKLITDLYKLDELSIQLKEQDQVLVFTNGCFDILHPGHISTFEKAKDFGDILVVGMNSDSSIRALKGPSRPIMNQYDRAYMLSALESIDYIYIFDDTRCHSVIDKLKPDFYVKGKGWSLNELNNLELEALIKAKTQIRFVDNDFGNSSQIVKKIQELF